MKSELYHLLNILSVMLAFFATGFVDLVGIASSYVKEDFLLSNSSANLFSSMVFIWFLICSIPTGILMNKVGRKKTVIISLILTIIALLFPLIHYSLLSIIFSFSLIGIGNAIMQVSVNPLLSDVIGSKKLSSALTFGQFIKALASFVTPSIAALGVMKFNNWRFLFLVFVAEAIIAALSLWTVNIKEEKPFKQSNFKNCLSLLHNDTILTCFIAIICYVGINAGTNVSAPRIVMEKLNIPLVQASYITSLYFLSRIVGCLFGSFVLTKYSVKMFSIISLLMILAALVALMLSETKIIIDFCIAVIGFNNANLFSIIVSQAILHKPIKKNEISGLMITGLFGGALFLPIMGKLSDLLDSQNGAIIIIGIGTAYLFMIITKFKNTN